MKLIRTYACWKIWDHGENYHPITGRFTAMRHGVTLSASTEDLIIRMIQYRIKDYPASYGA